MRPAAAGWKALRLGEASNAGQEAVRLWMNWPAVGQKAVRLRKGCCSRGRKDNRKSGAQFPSGTALTQLHREGLGQPRVLHHAAVVVLVATLDCE